MGQFMLGQPYKFRWQILFHYFLVAIPVAVIAPANAVECPCPNRDDPVALLSCILDRPVDDAAPEIGGCIAQASDGYPAITAPNPRRPTVYRAYRIISTSDGKPYRGRATRRIQLEFSYIARITKRHPEGEMFCQGWKQMVNAYRTEQGWLISHPADGNPFYKMKSLLAADRARLEQHFAAKDMVGIHRYSSRISTVEIAGGDCPFIPGKPGAKWQR